MNILDLKTTTFVNHSRYDCFYELSTGEKVNLFFEVEPAISDFVLDRVDPFAPILLLAAIKNGEDLNFEVPITARLFHNFENYVSSLYRIILGCQSEIQISSNELLVEKNPKNKGIITGFSAGIDSFSVLNDYFFKKTIKDYKITHLLFNDVGSHGIIGKENIFRQRLNRIKSFSRKLGLPLITVQSNVQEILDIDFQLTHTVRNGSVAHLFESICSKFLYASTYHYCDISIKKTYDIAYADPILLPLISTKNMECISVGSQYSRVEKTKIVSRLPEAMNVLDVCISTPLDGKINCSKCWKCKRTMLTLEILGCLEQFDSVFDLEIYRKEREILYIEVIHNNDPLLIEIAELAKSKNFKLYENLFMQLRVFILSQLYRTLRLAPESTKRKLKKLCNVGT